MTKILDLNHTEARQYFLKEESYFNFDLPSYFVFENLLQAVSAQIGAQELQTFHSTYNNPQGQPKRHSPAEFEDVNHKFLNNKDGKFAWRPFQLIHPALYVSLVHNITEEINWNTIVARFGHFASNPKI